LFFVYTSLFANFLIANTEIKEKHDISICAIFKNEAIYIEEWIEYHLNIGIDHFYLYNVGSSDGYENVLKTYIKNNIVTLVNWPEILRCDDDYALHWALCTQISAYENAVNFLAKDETQWLVLLDINEFLQLPGGDVKKILHQYCTFSGISFYTEYSDRAIRNAHNEKILQHEMSVITDYSSEIMDKAVAKMIFKPDQCSGFNCSPYQCRFKEYASCIEADPRELLVKRYMNQKVYKNAEKDKCLKEKVAYPILSKEKAGPCDKLLYPLKPEFLRKLESITREEL